SKMGEADINTLTMEQYLALTRGNQALGMVKPKIKGNVNFEIKRQFMRELREDTFSGNKNDDAYEHVERILDIEPIPNKTPAQALEAIQTLGDHSQKGHDGSTSRKISNVGCKSCGGAHLNKDCPLQEEVKSIKEVKKTDEELSEVLPCQLPLKELCPGSFTLPYTIGSMNLYATADLGASVNIMLKSMFNHLKLTNLKETNMLLEMADMTKEAPMGIVKNVLVKINKFIFPFDFMIIDMLGDPNETMILGRPFLATIHARIDVFNREISLGVRGGTMYSWHNEGFEEEERWESGLDEKYYDPPQVFSNSEVQANGGIVASDDEIVDF
ncbi:putative reverse transcriptase domain-containing protein, partial [Tanacetum coccineum]